jgi:hypothetical protein
MYVRSGALGLCVPDRESEERAGRNVAASSSWEAACRLWSGVQMNGPFFAAHRERWEPLIQGEWSGTSAKGPSRSGGS